MFIKFSYNNRSVVPQSLIEKLEFGKYSIKI